MSTVTIKFDLYKIYERVLEDCIVNVILSYDINEIINKKDLSANTILIESSTISSDTLAYISSLPFDEKKIYQAVAKHFDDEDNLLEEWGEAVTDEEYNQIEFIILDQIRERNPDMDISIEET